MSKSLRLIKKKFKKCNAGFVKNKQLSSTVGRIYCGHVDYFYPFWVLWLILNVLKITLHTVMHLLYAPFGIILMITWW